MADVVVVGAGVIGLTSAICLAEDGVDVRIVAAAPPQKTTSRAASAMWGSSFAGPADDVRRWAEASLAELRVLAEDPASGVHIARGTLAARSSDLRARFEAAGGEIEVARHVEDRHVEREPRPARTWW